MNKTTVFIGLSFFAGIVFGWYMFHEAQSQKAMDKQESKTRATQACAGTPLEHT